MLPERVISFGVAGRQLVPDFLGPHDHPWLRDLIERTEASAGRPERQVYDDLREGAGRPSPTGKRRMVLHVLRRLCRPRRSQTLPPRTVRALVFGHAARLGGDVTAAWAASAQTLGVPAEALQRVLLSDLPGERPTGPPPSNLSPSDLALRTNLALARSLLARSARVRVELEGNARAVVRYACLRGLICTVAGRGDSGDVSLEISGPFSLFRKTLVYGRALADLVPQLAWCDRYRLTAECVLRGGRELDLALSNRDALLPATEPRRYDSRVEARFARDFGRLAPDWRLVREPEPVAADGTLVYPDFALVDQRDPTRRWLMEIAGFWTPEYVDRKLARLRSAGVERLLLCIDADLNCAEQDLPAGATVLRYKRWVDATDVLARISGG